MNGPLFPGGQSYDDFVANEHRVRDHRGNRIIHGGKRTNDSIRRSMAIGAAATGTAAGWATANTMHTGTVGEFFSPDRLASGIPGAVAGAAIGAAAAYGLRKKLG